MSAPTNLLTEDIMETAARQMARGSSRRATTEWLMNQDNVQELLEARGLSQIEGRRIINRQIRFADKSSPEFRPTKFSGIWEIEREAIKDATRDALKESVDGLVGLLTEASTQRKETRGKLQEHLDEFFLGAVCPTETDEALRLITSIQKLQDGEIAAQTTLVRLLHQLASSDAQEGTQLALPPLSP